MNCFKSHVSSKFGKKKKKASFFKTELNTELNSVFDRSVRCIQQKSNRTKRCKKIFAQATHMAEQ